MKMSIVYVVTGLNAIPLNGVDREALSSVNMNVLHPCRCVVERVFVRASHVKLQTGWERKPGNILGQIFL